MERRQLLRQSGKAIQTWVVAADHCSTLQPLQLYNLTRDIHENSDIAQQHPNVIKAIEMIAKAAHVDDPNWPITKCNELPPNEPYEFL